MNKFKKIFVPGGAGYVGSVLVPELLKQGYEVVVYDLYIYGKQSLSAVRGNPRLTEIQGDVRDTAKVKSALQGCDAVIHLACISNDPSVELNQELSESVNYRSFEPMILAAKEEGVKRFIFASSGSVYGVSDSPSVTEEHPLVPVSFYNRYKAMCEPVLLKHQSKDFTTVIIRPATVCGYSPRQRLDLTVNILTNHAFNKGLITVLGGAQKRPNIHIKDMVDLYCKLLQYDSNLIAGQIFNAGFENLSVSQIAGVVKEIVEKEVPEREHITIETSPSNDPRSYHISSEKIQRVLGFHPQYTIADGVRDLIGAFREGLLPDSLNEIRYFNVKLMKHINLS
ncbi:MAG: NAD(P)-dependent oxidoreductase [Oligoflexia bacterium]|nr:NAD(P)-dependent oxidoreductase [Oligoflexia bacterium]